LAILPQAKGDFVISGDIVRCYCGLHFEAVVEQIGAIKLIHCWFILKYRLVYMCHSRVEPHFVLRNSLILLSTGGKSIQSSIETNWAFA